MGRSPRRGEDGTRAEEMPDWVALFPELEKADSSVTGKETDGRKTAKVVQVRDGEHLVTDGPFAQTKEILGGVFLMNLLDLDEAIRVAAADPVGEARLDRDPPRAPIGLDAAGRRARLPERNGVMQSILTRVLGDLELAEDAVQDARSRRFPRALGRETASPNAGCVDRHDGSQPGDRPDPAREGDPAESRAHRPPEELPAEEDDVTRSPTSGSRSSSRAATPRSPPRAASRSPSARSAGSRPPRSPRVPRRRARHGSTPRAREAEDPKRGNSIPVPPDYLLPSGCVPASRPSDRLQRGCTRRPTSDMLLRGPL